MTQIHADLPDKAFDPAPDTLIRRSVDTMSGKMPTELSMADPRGTVITEWFIPGTEPREPDDVHVKAAVCTESGKLITEYCPTTLIEERILQSVQSLTSPYLNKQLWQSCSRCRRQSCLYLSR